MKRIVHFTYAAIKRYGAKRWTVRRGAIEINTNYVVSVGESEIYSLHNNGRDYPYFIELSNGTKLLIYLHDFDPADEILGEAVEISNELVADDVYSHVSFSMLNSNPL